jgi:hypothetical protein
MLGYKLVKVAWKARVHPDDLPVYWKHCPREIFWVIGHCEHWLRFHPLVETTAIMKRSSRKNGPISVVCYECGVKKT